MYHLNKFCNIIFELRKERGWTQLMLAEKLNISPQSISKWECGIGYPDVTLFPLIAELFNVDIGVLFGQNKEVLNMNYENERSYVFEPLDRVEFFVGNECDIIVTRKDGDSSRLEMTGDATFIEFLNIEKVDTELRIRVKNPTGSESNWMPYDRGNYQKHNTVTLYTGKQQCQLFVVNYLDLNVYESEIGDDTDKWAFKKKDCIL